MEKVNSRGKVEQGPIVRKKQEQPIKLIILFSLLYICEEQPDAIILKTARILRGVRGGGGREQLED